MHLVDAKILGARIITPRILVRANPPKKIAEDTYRVVALGYEQLSLLHRNTLSIFFH